MPRATTGDRRDLKPVNVGAAAIDIGSKMHMAAVDPNCADVPVRTFGTFTQDLYDLADWFKACGVNSVAMEPTGVYWIPVFEILEQRGFDVILVNARYAKTMRRGNFFLTAQDRTNSTQGAPDTGRGQGRRGRLHRALLQSQVSALDDRISEPYRVRKADRISLSACQRNRVQAKHSSEKLQNAQVTTLSQR
jgi:hypothetical protein